MFFFCFFIYFSLACLIYTTVNYVTDTVWVFLLKCPLTTVRSRFSAVDLQIVWGEAEDTSVVCLH